jgi:cobalt-zinc-cadmium efflux system outer membrane protein
MKILHPRQLAVRVVLLVVSTLFGSVLAETSPKIVENTFVDISTFISTSLVQHPQLLAAKADIQSAKAALRAASQAIYNPELEFDYEDTAEITKSVGIKQTIDWGDQQGSRTALAKANLNKASINYNVVVQSFISSVLAGLAENQTEKDLVELNNKTLKLMNEFKRVADRRFQAGDLTQVELNLTKLAYTQAVIEQVNAQTHAIEAYEKLQAILGMEPLTIPMLPEQLVGPVFKIEQEELLRNLPIVRAQLAQVEFAKQKIAVRKSEQAWNPTIGVSAGLEGSDNLIGLNLSLPLNIRNDFSAEVDVAQQELIASEQRAQQAYRNTKSKLNITTERYRNLLSAWNNWRVNSRENVEQQLMLIEQLWQVGEISATDYLLQLKQIVEIQAAGLELRNQLWQAAFDWMNLTATVNNWLNINIELLDTENYEN